MNEDLKIIKKKYGEGMAHFCRDYFPILLETNGLLPNLLLKKFEPNKALYNDIVEANLEEKFKEFIYSLVDIKEEPEEKTTKSPQELMLEAGYDLYECRTEEDIQSFKKYYAEGEELCTFRGGRLNRCYVFFAVRHDVDKIKREDFKEPKREDLYGTSVISIQFARNNSHFLSIKNRYNHRVNNPDATFSNNLENIISGLTKSFEDYYYMKQEVKSNNFEIPNYVLANDGKYYKYNYELYNAYYCPNNIVVDTDGVHRFDPSKYLVLDYFILDLANKKIYLYNLYIDDPFPNTIGEIDKIEILKTEYGKEIRITNKNNEVCIIEIDKENKIIGYINEYVKEITNGFLSDNKSLIKLSLPKVLKIGNDFLNRNKILKEIDLPNVRNIGGYFLYSNLELQEISLSNAIIIGSNFLNDNQKLKILNLPNVKIIGNYFLSYNNVLKELNLPNAEVIGCLFLYSNNCLKTINIPQVKSIGDSFLTNNGSLQEINSPNVREIGKCFLSCNLNLKELDLPNVKTIGNDFLKSNKILERINLPKVVNIGVYFLFSNKNLREIDLSNVEILEDYFLETNQEIKKIRLSSVEIIGRWVLSNSNLGKIDLPNVRRIGDYFLNFNEILEEINIPKVKRIGQDFLHCNTKLKTLNLPNVVEIGNQFLCLNTNELTINAPKLLIVHNYQNGNLLFEIAEENKEKLERKEGKKYKKIKKL